MGEECQSVGHNRQESNLIPGEAGLSTAVLYSGKGRSTKEFSFVIMQRERPEESKPLLPFTLLRSFTSVQALTHSASFLPALLSNLGT